jgi:hypothetical protein
MAIDKPAPNGHEKQAQGGAQWPKEKPKVALPVEKLAVVLIEQTSFRCNIQSELIAAGLGLDEA